MGRLAGKRVIITGGAAGIGRACLHKFVAEGASVVIGDIDRESAEQTIAGMTNSAWFLPCDVSDEASVSKFVQGAAEKLGGLDVVVNNAGMLIHKNIADITVVEWDKVYGVNVRSQFLLMKYAEQHLKISPAASIVNMSSMAGLRGGPASSAYASSKAAIIGLTVAMAMEFSPFGIRVNAVCPGWVDTPFNGPAIDYLGGPHAQSELIKRGTPLARQGTVDEIAATVLFLASDEASYITAQAISVNGGAYN